MSINHQCKRLISLILVLFMVIGMMPVNVHAASDTAVDAAIIFTDLHTNSSDYKESTVKGIMTAFKNAGLPISSVTSGGDAFSVNADSTKYTGDPTKITGYIQNVLGNVPVHYVWSDHDRYGTGIDQKSQLVYGAGNDGVYGTADDGNYYIYSLSMGDLCTYDRYSAGFNYTLSSNNRTSKGFTATVPEAIANFKADAAKLCKDRPLLIVSHQPLFDNRNDNGWAEDWCDAINEVATDMDIAFFYGHNHKYDSGSDYYYAKGSTMAVATRKLSNGSDWNYAYQTGSGWQYNNDLASVNKVLNFTHMCAGYLAPSSTGSTSSTTREGTAMAVTIYDDSIRFTTYNSSGIYTGSYAVDKTVTREFASTEPELVVSGTATYFTGDALDLSVIYKAAGSTEDVTSKATLTGYNMNAAGDYTVQIAYGDLTAEFAIIVREKTFTDAATGITAEVSVPGATGMTVSTLGTDSQAYLAVAALLSKAVAYDIDLVNGTEATISLPVPAGVVDPVVYHVSDDGQTITKMDLVQVGNTVTFEADQFSFYVIGQDDRAPESNDVVVGDAGYSYVQTTATPLEDGYYLLQNNHTSRYLTNTSSGNRLTITDAANRENHVWYIKAVSGGYTVQYGGPDGQYLTFSHEKAAMSTSAQTIDFLNTNGYWGIGATSGSPAAYLARYGTNSSSTTVHGYASSSYYYPSDTGMNWNLYERIENQTTYSVDASNVQHYLGQNDDQVQLTYTLLANGAAGNLPAGGSWTFETYKDTDGIVKSISNSGVITFNKVAGSCYVKIAYTWNEGSAYSYVKIITERDPNACDHEYTAVTVDATCTEDGSITYTCDCGDTYTEVIAATGHNYESVVTAPTCTKEGYTTYTCATCGDTYVADKVAATGHDYKSVVTAPTCTEEGYTTYTCACGDTYTANEVAAKGHSYESVTVEATCTKDGSITYTCACGDSYVETIKATGHSYKSVVTAPTCTEEGYTTYTCACGDSYVTDKVAALGHAYESVTVEATCTKDGSITYTCACGDSYVETIKAIGHDYKSVVTAPTCTEEGYTTYTCSNCSHSYTADKVAALGHNYKSVVTAPTCIAEGYTTYTCATCGDSYVADKVAALGHDYKSVTVEATCTKDGSITYTCACGETYKETIKALGHAYTSEVTAPTCTAEGYTTYTCSNCDESYKSDKVAALGHDHKSVTVEATCTEDGSITYTCHCGDTYTEVIKATGHKYESVVTAPTCTEDGYTTYTCVCGDSYIADEVKALGHTYESVTLEATCTKDGSITYTCACGDSYVEVIKAIGHDYKSVVTAPTCTEEGFTTFTCANCGDSYTADKVAALGHKYESKVTAPTCTEDGFTTYTCACGDSYIADEVAALGHNYKSVTVDATCTKDGSVTYTCACGDSYKETIKALGHDYTSVVTAPTCTEEGYTTYTCATCGHSEKNDKVAALGHDHESVTVEATCTADGSVTATCRVCGDSKVEVIKATGHDYTAVVTAPTCTEAGYTTYTCHCGDTYVADEVKALGHVYESVTVPATCTEDGSVTYTCVCGDSYVEVIAALGHKYESKVTAPTCTEEGYTTYTCACGDTYVADEVAALGHTYESVVTAPTCTEAGYTTYTCACGDTYVADEVAALGHTYKSVVTAPTCTEAGYTTYTCACGDTYVADKVAALGHTYKSVTVEATCTKDGSITYTCACGDSYVEVIAALGHKYESKVTAPTCTEEGYTTYTCATCGDTYTADKVAALGHDYESVTVEATCTVDGSVTYTCHCGDSYVEVIKATGHDYTSVVTAPTCTEKGFTTYTCAICDDTYVADEVAALGHDYESVTVEPTCTKYGTITYTCACGDTYVEYIDSIGHKYEAVITAPTCTEGGYTTYTCSNCGNFYTAEKVEALGHDYAAVVTAPTCTEAGYTTYTCSVCDDSYVGDETAALGHTYESKVTAPTCTEGGYTTYTCACGHSYVGDETDALGHTYESVVTAPTCTEGGYTTYTCACGHNYVGDKTDALGHSYDAVVTEPTNTQGGYTTYTCACGHSYIGDETEALENSVVAGGTAYEEKTVYVRVDSFENGGKYVLIGEDKPTNGNKIAYLNNSGKEGWETVSINSGSVTSGSTTYSNGYIEIDNANAVWTASGSASAGYTLTNNGRYIGGTNANTLKNSSSQAVKMVYDASAVRLKTASGTTRYLYYSTYGSENWKWATSKNSSSSSRNMWIYKEVTVRIPTSAPATYTLEASDVQHVLVDYTAQLQYTLLADGVATNLPSGGSYSFQVTNDTKGIIAGISDTGLITFNNVAGTCRVKITCTWNDGSVYRYVKVTTELDPNACDHVYTSETVAPTCTEDGYTTYTCTVCGDSYAADEVAALGHTHDAETTAPTCTEEGYTTYTCVTCGYSEKGDVVAALGHSYVCTEVEGCLVYTCACGASYTESYSSEWVKTTGAYILDTDGIDVGADHKYIVVGSDQDYALTMSDSNVGAAKVTIQNNSIVLDDASAYEFYFVSNNSREGNTYLLTRDGSNGIYHMNGNMYYGNDNKGYWYFGSSSNGAYQLYDYDNCNWFLNYGNVWGSDRVSRFAVSYNNRSVRLFKYTEAHARLTGSIYQVVAGADGATVDSVLNKLSIETSADGVNVSGTAAVTADMVAWDNTFDGTTPGTYTATVTYEGIQLGTIKVIVK